MRPARLWNRWASSGSTPRWRSRTWAWVHASVATRSKVAGSRYLSARSRATSRDGATRVENVTRTPVPGSSRTRRRRLTIGSSTAAAAEEAGAVGLPLQAADAVAFDHRHVRQPDRRVAARPRPARHQQRVQL